MAPPVRSSDASHARGGGPPAASRMPSSRSGPPVGMETAGTKGLAAVDGATRAKERVG